MITKIQLFDKNQTTIDFTGFKVNCIYSQRLNEENTVDKSEQMSASKEGIVLFNYDNSLVVTTPVFISIKSPENIIVKEAQIDQVDIFGRPTFPITFELNKIELGVPEKFIAPRSSLIHGRLLEKTGKKKLEEIQIIIFASITSNSEDFQPILSTVTEAGGYFSLPNPNGSFQNAFALVGVKAKETKVPIKLDPIDEQKNVFPEKLILIIELDEATEEQSISCDGDCKDLNFHQPKRILEEFTFYSVIRTSDPEIKSFTIKEQDELTLGDFINQIPVSAVGIFEAIKLNPNKVFGISFNTISSSNAVARVTASPTSPSGASNVINNEEILKKLHSIKINKKVATDFLDKYQALNQDTIGKLIEMNEVHSLTNILNKPLTLPQLGRFELDSNHLIDWDEDPTIYQATGISYGHLLNWRQEWVADGYSIGDLLYSLALAPGQIRKVAIIDFNRKELASNTQKLEYSESLYNSLSRDRDLSEIVHGTISESIHANSWASTWGAAGGVGGFVGVVFGAGGGYSKSKSGADQNSLRQAASSDMQHLRDRTIQSANAVRSQRATVIQTVSQGETLEAHSESVANYNHCHALTIEYFEVLRHFKVQQRLADVKECLFIPLSISEFDPDKALRWKGILKEYCIDARLKKAFDSLERAVFQWRNSDLPDTTFAAERIQTMMGNLRLKFVIPRPADMLVVNDKVIDYEITDNLGNTRTVYKPPIKEWVYDPSKWTWFTPLLEDNPEEYYKDHLSVVSVVGSIFFGASKDSIFQKEIAPRVAQQIVKRMQFTLVNESGAPIGPLPLEATLVSKYQRDRALTISVRLKEPINYPREKVQYIEISLKNSQDLPILPDNANIIVESGELNYRTKHFSGPLFKYALINNDLVENDGVLLYCGPSAEELRNPKQEDINETNILIRYLNDSLEECHKWIWNYMTPERRFMLLDGIKLKLKNGEERSVASLVENRLIGVVGNSIVMPVAAGLELNPDFERKMLNTDTGELIPLIEYYDQTPQDPISISIPTKGVFAEAIMGKCNSCEIKDERRFWRWDEAPIPDSPTTINPINMDSRRADPGNLQPMPLPNPVVNIQNAPNVPDPTGLANLMQLLGKPDIFKDMTGLNENQKNALATLQASFGAAQQFGTMAATLQGKELDLKAIQEGKKSGTISNDQASKAVDNILPKSDDEKIDAAKKKVDFISEALQKQQINEDQANQLTNEVMQSINPPKRVLSRIHREKQTQDGTEVSEETYVGGQSPSPFLIQNIGSKAKDPRIPDLLTATKLELSEDLNIDYNVLLRPDVHPDAKSEENANDIRRYNDLKEELRGYPEAIRTSSEEVIDLMDSIAVWSEALYFTGEMRSVLSSNLTLNYRRHIEDTKLKLAELESQLIQQKGAIHRIRQKMRQIQASEAIIATILTIYDGYELLETITHDFAHAVPKMIGATFEPLGNIVAKRAFLAGQVAIIFSKSHFIEHGIEKYMGYFIELAIVIEGYTSLEEMKNAITSTLEDLNNTFEKIKSYQTKKDIAVKVHSIKTSGRKRI